MGTNITGIGNANAIGFKSRVTGGAYFPPELKDALVGVWSAYGKSNDSTDRNIIKNKIKDRGGDFELINFNYEGTSGYNGYPIIFGKDKTYQYVNHSPNYNQTTINVTHFNTRQALLYSYIQRNGELTSYNRDYPSYKIKVSGLEEGFGLMYQYNSKADATSVNALRIEANGIYTIPKSFASDGSLTNANIWVGFIFTGTEQEQCNVTIEVLPEYKGAVVTDGVDDMIISTKTVSEMLEGSNEVTVISMIRQIKNSPDSIIRNNWMFRPEYYLENKVSDESIGKSGIYGYTSSNISGAQVSVINNILGDKNDYTGNSKIESTSLDYFSVEGFRHSDGNMWYLSQVAWYWTFIAKRVLTEDEINLIIEKYNLDRPGEIVKPDVYYDIKRQKITNENHSSFDDELTDFSGNGHNMKLYNIAWEGNSGIGNYPVVFGANKTWKNLRAEDNNLSYKLIANSITVYKVLPNSGAIMWTYIKENEIIREIEIPSFTVKVSGTKNGDRVRYYYVDENSTFKNTIFDITEDGIYVLPKCNKLQITESTPSTNIFIGFVIILNDNPSTGVTIEVIPSNENAICLDGVDDYGKVTGLPIYKDYTVAALRKWLYDDSVTSTQTGSIVSKSKFGSDGAFIFEQTLNKNPSRSSTWCFGLTNSLINNDKLFEESFTYQTKYSYNNNPIQPGTGFDRDSMWLGSVRDNDSRYSKMAIWSLLLFPYSLSEFLLERQIKKARAGTLYPNQVEFRPIIPEDENITRIDYFVVNSGTWIVIKPGDYVDVGARIVFNVYTKLPYKVEKVSSPAFTGMSVRHSTELNIFDVEGYIKDKTPQKIKLTLAVNEDIVQWNPTITSNLLDSFTASSWYLNGWDNTLTEGTWIKKTDRVFFKATFKTELYGLETATFGGAECVVSKADNWSDSKNIWDIRMLGTVGDLSQIFNLDVYELIRFEDIVQPYPVLLRFKDENGNEVSWGGKFRVGSTITRIGSFNDCNLLKDIYTVSNAKLNGSPLPSTPHVVEKQMVFTCTATYLLDDNEPKCVFSPSKLRIPNSSYKYLGYIPDISGNGNHGVFNNFAFSKMSGADGYPYDYKSTSDFVAHAINAVLVNSETVKFINVLTQTSFYYKGTSYKGKIKVTGITKAIASGKVRYLDIYSNSPTNNDRVIIDKDGIYDVNIETEDAINIFFYLTPIVSGTTALDEPVYLEQVGNYEGSICFDGVDDYMDIPSLSIGGKQVLMKTNWLKSPTLLYDQRASGSFAILTTKEDDATNPRIAYQARNQDGKTYIDGIENNYIETYSLKGITHNITVTNPSAGSGVVPVIGANTGKSSSFAKMALYDFMLFDEVSTNEEIKQLNDIVGIEGNYVQRPPYYWDTHGKSNLDGDRGTIPQLGTAEDYSFTSFDNEIDWYLSSSNYIDVVSRNGYKITLKNLSTGIDGWRFQNSTVKRFILNDIPFKIKSNKTIRVYWDMHYNAISSTELRQKVVSVTTINPNEDTLINLRHLTEEELTELNVNKSTMYYLLWFDVSTLAVNEEVTIEMLPVEGGRNLWLNNYGFAYDKMSGYEGYSFKSFNDSQSWNIRGDSTGVEIISRNGYSMTVKKLVQNLDWQISNNEYRYPTILDKEVPFKCKSNKNVGLIWQLKYETEGATSDTTVTLINQQLTPNVPLEISLPYKTQDELTELGAVSTSVYYLLYFSNTLLEIGEEYTVEMLPLYPNGLVYDGVDDYSENTSIPAFTDYTYIFKRTLLNKKYNSASAFKGNNKQAGGGAFICDYNSVEPDLLTQGYSFGAGLYVDSLNADSIVYGTRGSVNGTKITAGNNTDTEGLTVGKWRAYKEMVFYKLFLYPRTVNMLSINMVKNMMEEDGIIDLTSKLFTDKYTGDFYEMDFNNDFLIGN